MTKSVTVGELIKELLKLPQDKTVELSVNYDHCDHVQTLKGVYYNEGLSWIVLSGKELK